METIGTLKKGMSGQTKMIMEKSMASYSPLNILPLKGDKRFNESTFDLTQNPATFDVEAIYYR